MMTRFFLLLAAMLVAGCANTTLTEGLRDPGFTGPLPGKLLVMAITDNGAARRLLENALAAQLNARGLVAFPSYAYIPQDGQAEEEKLKEAVRQTGAEAVLTARDVGTEARTETSPGYVSPQPLAYPYAYPYAGMRPLAPGVALPSLYSYYASSWTVYQPPTTYTVYSTTLELSLFTAPAGNLVWSAVVNSQSEMRASPQGSLEVGKVVADALERARLLPPAPTR